MGYDRLVPESRPRAAVTATAPRPGEMSDLELREHLRQGHGEVAATEAPKGFTMLMWHDLLHILGQMTCAHIHSAEMVRDVDPAAAG